jgi:hypothetical protein
MFWIWNTSGSRDGSSKKSTPSRDKNDRNDRGKDRKNEKAKDKVEKEDTNKEKPKTEITVTMGEKYDPAEPTEDITEVNIHAICLVHIYTFT